MSAAPEVLASYTATDVFSEAETSSFISTHGGDHDARGDAEDLGNYWHHSGHGPLDPDKD